VAVHFRRRRVSVIVLITVFVFAGSTFETDTSYAPSQRWFMPRTPRARS